jgi:hypothetical protein
VGRPQLASAAGAWSTTTGRSTIRPRTNVQVIRAHGDFTIDPLASQPLEKNLGQPRIQLGAREAVVAPAAIQRRRGDGRACGSHIATNQSCELVIGQPDLWRGGSPACGLAINRYY